MVSCEDRRWLHIYASWWIFRVMGKSGPEAHAFFDLWGAHGVALRNRSEAHHSAFALLKIDMARIKNDHKL